MIFLWTAALKISGSEVPPDVRENPGMGEGKFSRFARKTQWNRGKSAKKI
jgi:hypothetical protein